MRREIEAIADMTELLDGQLMLRRYSRMEAPCLPHLGFYLQKITQLEESYPMTHNMIRINFSHCMARHELAVQALSFQGSKKPGALDPDFPSMFEDSQLMSTKEAYDASLRLEPRGRELTRAGLQPSRDLFLTTILYEFEIAELMQMEASMPPDQFIEHEIVQILGPPKSWARTESNDEFQDFRMFEVAGTRHDRRYSRTSTSTRHSEKACDDILKDVPRWLTAAPFESCEVPLVFWINETRDVVVANLSDSIHTVIRRMVLKSPDLLAVLGGSDQVSPSMFALKAVGFVDYVFGSEALGQFQYVRTCLKKGKPIAFHLMFVSSIPVELMEDGNIVKEVSEDYHRPPSGGNTIAADRYHEKLRVHMLSITNLDLNHPWLLKKVQKNRPESWADSQLQLFVRFTLCLGEIRLCPKWESTPISANSTAEVKQTFHSVMDVSDLPPESRLCITLYGRRGRRKAYPLGWVNCQLVDYRGLLMRGRHVFPLWPLEKANKIGTCVRNSDPEALAVVLEFDEGGQQVFFKKPEIHYEATQSRDFNSIRKDHLNTLVEIFERDPLSKLTAEECALLRAHGPALVHIPKALPKYLRAVDWTNHQDVEVAHALLGEWALFENPADALELLDANYADFLVRKHAVRCLESMSDEDLLDYLLQLTQVIKYEPYHDSPLARFLVRRAIHSTQTVGHYFFWLLKAEMHISTIQERYGLLLAEYLRHCGSHRKSLLKQASVVQQLVGVSDQVKCVPKKQRVARVVIELRKVRLPDSFVLPLDPRRCVNSLVMERCKCMDSKKVPLWLVFKNADPRGDPVFVMFKAGDDLRQDQLTLQLIRLMDKLWQLENLDLRMNPYQCVATGDEEGFLEIVLNSTTTANITKKYGGALGAFKKETINNWLLEQNPNPEDMERAVENFARSNAAYCVATYVLGIGDRHNDNVMVTESGQLFHIDFGHFLGNIKKKFGIKRERAPFVFTSDFAFVLGGTKGAAFKEFQSLSCQAYNVLRRNGSRLIILFALMLSTGIPELQKKEDIMYLQKALNLGKSNEDANGIFLKLINESLDSLATKLNNMFHLMAH